MSWKNLLNNYLGNGFVLLLPVFLWNFFLTSRLPESYQLQNFWRGIPHSIALTETVLRILIFSLPLFFRLGFQTPGQKLGWLLYFCGLVLYFASWLMQIYFPDSLWSQSVIGFTAPAFTSALWLVGIGLIGRTLFFKIPYHYSIYLGITAGFVLVHSAHAYLVYTRI